MASRHPRMPELAGRLHALGPADDTAAHLAALTGTSAAALEAATEHLDAAIAPGGRACPVSADVAVHVCELLTADLVPDAATRVELLYFLGQVTEAADASVAATDPATVLDCRAALPRILGAAEHCESDDVEEVRVEAADTAESALEVMEHRRIR